MDARQKGLLVIAFILLAISGPAGYAATNYYVWRDNPLPQTPFTNWTMAATNIQVAVDRTIDGDTVYVTNGTYDTGGAVTPGYALTNRVCITNKITLQSMNGPAVTIIKGAPAANGYLGDDAVRCVYLTNTPVLLGFTLTNGYTMTNGNDLFDRCGGGLFYNANSIVSNCVVTKNVAHQNGGGVYMNSAGAGGSSANVTQGLYNCTISWNTATNNLGASPEALRCRGAGVNMQGGMMTNCILTRNKAWGAASAGGGVWVEKYGSVNNCTFTYNEAGQGCGATAGGSNPNTPCSVNNCTFIGNIGPSDQSQIFIGGVGAFLRNSLVIGNLLGNGVSLYVGGSMINCTVVSNSNYGVRDHNATAVHASCYVLNSIVRNNWQNFYITTNSPTGTGTYVRCTASTPYAPYFVEGVAGNTTNDPKFVNAGEGNYRLTANSPCINTGTNEAWMTNSVDLDGRTRIRYGTVDMGAYELMYRGTIFTGR